MIVFLAMLAFLLLYWTVEAVRLRRALRAIPVRIHVNGSRGKSSVTRLIAAALREAGVPTVAKTTGTRARFIRRDGSEEPVVRIGTPNICEQVGILDRARREGAQAIVMECMAIRPDLQRVTEERILHSTIGVITNIRGDHLDVMGPTVEDAALALASTMPRHGHVVIGEDRFVDLLRRRATGRGSRLEIADTDDLPPNVMDEFTYLEHPDNVATALAVARQLGIPDQISLSGMVQAQPDPGACTRWNIEHGGVQIEFQNIFAANDLDSTISIWQRLGLSRPDAAVPTVALLNLRGDRIDRSLQFAEAVETRLRADFYVLVGELSSTVLRRYERKVPARQLLVLGKAAPADVFDRIAARLVELDSPRVRIGGIGNIGGLGHEVLQFVARAGGVPC